MEKKWIKDLCSNECIHTPTQDIAYVLCVKFNELGLKWSSGISYLDNTKYNVYKENTHYYPYDGSYSDKDYTEECSSKVYAINDLLDFEGEPQSDESYTKEEIELLDRFAGMIMQGLMSKAEYFLSEYADTSYRLAKEMLRARKEALNNG